MTMTRSDHLRQCARRNKPESGKCNKANTRSLEDVRPLSQHKPIAVPASRNPLPSPWTSANSKSGLTYPAQG